MESESRLHITPLVRDVLFCLVVIALIAIAYVPAIDAPFVFDDNNDILANSSIRHVWPPDAFIMGRRPFANGTFALSWWMGGGTPPAFRAFNVVLHAANAVLVFVIVRQALRLKRIGYDDSRSAFMAFAAAAIWGAHPLATSCVTYITHRYESLAAFFYFGAIAAFLHASQRKRFAWLAVLACSFGGLTKEIAVTAPLCLLLIDATLVSDGWREALRARWKTHLALWCALVPLVLVLNVHPSAPSQNEIAGEFSRWDYLAAQPQVVAHYLSLVVWPRPLVIDYYDWPVGFRPQAGAFFVLALLAATVIGTVRRSLWALPFAIFFLVLLPTSSVVPLQHELVAERRVYIPLAALCISGVVVVRAIGARLSDAMRPRVLGALGAAVALGLSLVTVVRHADYTTNVGMYAHEVAARPANARARMWYATYLLQANRVDAAASAITAAVALDPDVPGIAVIASHVAIAQDRIQDALAWARRSLQAQPDIESVVYSAATVFVRAGAVREAISLLDENTSRSSAAPLLVDLLAWYLATESEVRDGPRAVQAAERALRLYGPTPPDVCFETLPAALAASERWLEAVEAAERSARMARNAGNERRARRLEAQGAMYARHLPWTRELDRALAEAM